MATSPLPPWVGMKPPSKVSWAQEDVCFVAQGPFCEEQQRSMHCRGLGGGRTPELEPGCAFR
eukprot:11637417-Alexandrium_andersonii.AAC.1